MGQLLDLQKLSLEKELTLSADQAKAFGDSLEVFLSNQQRFQEINEEIAALAHIAAAHDAPVPIGELLEQFHVSSSPVGLLSVSSQSSRKAGAAPSEADGVRHRQRGSNRRQGLSARELSPLQPQQLEIALRGHLFDTGRARRVLGWRPRKTDIESAIDAYEWHCPRGPG